MSTIPTMISVGEYLGSTYHPDRDYIDGELLERNAGETLHGRQTGASRPARSSASRSPPVATAFPMCVSSPMKRIAISVPGLLQRLFPARRSESPVD
jgi:hypothetical protein